jgi:poly-gamma-glutamate capsule biosynthesis protein CapA/YwtB (metallophosphatase superfamily)
MSIPLKITIVFLLIFIIYVTHDGQAQEADSCFVDLMAVGDVMLARGVNNKIKKVGPDYPFEKTQEIISLADIAFCNLECAISSRATGDPYRNIFCIKPEDAKSLSSAGFDLISLANNHTLDSGKKGLLNTMEFLTQEKIKYVGAGKTKPESTPPTFFEVKGIKIAFLAFSLYPMDWVKFKENDPAIAFYDSSRVKEIITNLKNEVELIVVSLHWGIEYRKSPTSSQIRIAHQLIDAGASLILGHHPHVVQKIEEYKGGVIVYSLGNFVFDQHKPETKKSIIFKAKLSRKGVVEYSTLPIQIVRFQPTLKKD